MGLTCRVALGTALLLGVVSPSAVAAEPGPIPVVPAGQHFTTVNTAGSFSWALAGMTDLDQVRGTDAAADKRGLPGDGKMFCVPTSLTNVLVYLGGLGWTGTNWPAAIDYTAASNYNEGTDAITKVGEPMGTTTGGTSGAGFGLGLEEFLSAGKGPSQVTAFGQSIYLDYADKWTPSPREMAAAGAAGALVLGHISFYDDAKNSAGETVKVWDGGHEFTVTGASAAGFFDPVVLRVRDPATPWVVDTVQSAFVDDEHRLTRRTLKFHQGGDQTVWIYDGNENVVFDGYTVITPQEVWTIPKPGLVAVTRAPIIPGPGPVSQDRFETPGDRAVVDMAVSAQGGHLLFLLKGSSNVWRLDPATGQTRAIAKVAGARSLVVGGTSQDVFVAGSRALVSLDHDGRQLGRIALSEPVQDLSFTDRGNALVSLDADGRTLRIYSSALRRGAVKSLPASQKLRFLATDRFGQVVLGSPTRLTSTKRAGGSAMARAAARVPVSSGPAIRGVGLLDDGTFAMSRGGKLVLVDAAGRSVPSPLAGAPSTGAIATNRGFNGFTPRSRIKSLDFVSDQFGPLRPPG